MSGTYRPRTANSLPAAAGYGRPKVVKIKKKPKKKGQHGVLGQHGPKTSHGQASPFFGDGPDFQRYT